MTTRFSAAHIERPPRTSAIRRGAPVDVIVTLIVVAACVRSSVAIVCSGCSADDRRECPNVTDCPGGLTLDSCDCCLECARVKGETCGGRYRAEGRCDVGLVCVITPVPGAVISVHEIGLCTELPTPSPTPTTPTTVAPPEPDADCKDVKCTELVDVIVKETVATGNTTNDGIGHQAQCPIDSIFVPPIANERVHRCCRRGNQPLWLSSAVNDAASSEASCRCLPCPEESVGVDETDEKETSDGCPAGQVRVLKAEGIPEVPGRCCDIYECIDHAKLCSDVECDIDPNLADVISCPNDSFRLPTLLTQDGCCTVEQGCQCKSLDSCVEVDCPDGFQRRIRQLSTGLPGYCCDIYDCFNGTSAAVCIHNGTTRINGEKWSSENCTECECRDGLSFCEPFRCPALPRCGWIGTPEGMCCPVCKGCISQFGDLQPTGSTWQLDNCVTCRCDQGQVYCQAQMCSVNCANPKVVPGECCPQCDENVVANTLSPQCPSLSNCTLMCSLGYVRTLAGCYRCECVQIFEDPCDLECPNGYRRDLLGIEICDCADVVDQPPSAASTTTNSVRDLILHSSPASLPGDPETSPFSSTAPEIPEATALTTMTFDLDPNMSPADTMAPAIGQIPCQPLSSNCAKQCLYGFRTDRFGCRRCRCNRCPPVDCSKRCRDGFAYNDAGCRLCRCLDANFIEKPPLITEEVTSVGKSVEGSDIQGSRRCISVDGQQTIEEGQSWWDGCRRCFCREGHEMCALTTCPSLRCINPIFRSDSCCPSCPGETALLPIGLTSLCHLDNGLYYGDGDTWQLDDCTLCICHQGAPLCIVDSCPPTLCRHPVLVPKMCCPVCPDNDGYLPAGVLVPRKTSRRSCRSSTGNRRFANGDTWRVDACQSCTCRDGQVFCFTQTCPITTCRRPVLKKGHCCPICSIIPLVEFCAYAGNAYEVGESWLVDECTQCTCVDSFGGVTSSSSGHRTGNSHNRGSAVTGGGGGQILCTIVVCDTMSLAKCGSLAAPSMGSCCPICLDNNDIGHTYNSTANQAILDDNSDDVSSRRQSSATKTTILIVFIIILSFIVLLLLTALLYAFFRQRHHRDDPFDARRHSGNIPGSTGCCVPMFSGRGTRDRADLDISRYRCPSLSKSSPSSSPRSAPPRYVDASRQRLDAVCRGTVADGPTRRWIDEKVVSRVDHNNEGRSSYSRRSSLTSFSQPPSDVVSTEVWTMVPVEGEKRSQSAERRTVVDEPEKMGEIIERSDVKCNYADDVGCLDANIENEIGPILSAASGNHVTRDIRSYCDPVVDDLDNGEDGTTCDDSSPLNASAVDHVEAATSSPNGSRNSTASEKRDLESENHLLESSASRPVAGIAAATHNRRSW